MADTIDIDDVTRTFSGAFTDIEEAAARISGDPEEWKKRYATSIYVSEQMSLPANEVFHSFDSYLNSYFKSDTVDGAYQEVLATRGHGDRISKKVTQPTTAGTELTKTLTRSTEALVLGGASGVATMLGFDDQAHEITRLQRNSAKALAPDREWQDKLRKTSGSWKQLATPEWWVVRGAEMVPNIAFFTGGGLGAFKLAGLLWKSKKVKAGATALSVGVGESFVNVGEATSQMQDRVESAKLAYSYLESIPKAKREQAIQQAALLSMAEYAQIIEAGGNRERAAEMAASVFLDNVFLNTALTAAGLFGGAIAGKAFFNSTEKRRLLKAAGGALLGIGTEGEQEVRQEEIVDEALMETLFLKEVNARVLSSALLDALTGDDKEKFDTAIAAMVMGARSAVVGAAIDISESRSISEAETRIKKISEALEGVEGPHVKSTKKILDSDKSAEEKLVKIQDKARGIMNRAMTKAQEAIIEPEPASDIKEPEFKIAETPPSPSQILAHSASEDVKGKAERGDKRAIQAAASAGTQIEGRKAKASAKRIATDKLRAQFKAHLADASKFRIAINKFMVENNIDMSERGKILPGIDQLFQRKTPSAREEQYKRVINRLAELQFDKERRDNLKTIKKTIHEGLKPKKDKAGHLISRGGPELPKKLRIIDALANMSRADYEDASDTVANRLERARSGDKDGAQDDAAIAKLEDEQHDIEVFGGLYLRDPSERKTPVEVTTALDELQAIIAGERRAYQAQQEQRREVNKQRRTDVVDGLGGYPSDKEYSNRRTSKRSRATYVNELLNDFANKHLSLAQKLDRLLDSDVGKIAKETIELFKKFIHVATQDTETANRLFENKFKAKIEEITGQRMGRFLKAMADDRFSIVTDDIPIYVNQDQALSLWLYMQQPALQDNMIHNGFSQKTFDDLEKKLWPKTKEIGRWMVNELADDYDGINERYRELFGIDMPSNAQYFPFSVDVSDRERSRLDPLGGPTLNRHTMDKPGGLVARVPHKKMVDLSAGAIVKFRNHKYQMNHFKTFGVGGRDFMSVFNNKDVIRTIKFHLGDRFYNEIMNHASQVISGGNQMYTHGPISDFMRFAYTVKALGLNLSVFWKQWASLQAFRIHMRWWDFQKAFFMPFSKEAREGYEILWNTDFIKNRWARGENIDVAFILQHGGSEGLIHRAVRIAMTPTRLGDMVPIFWMGRVIYQQSYKDSINRGMSHTEASKHAEYVMGAMVEETQQSASWKDQTHWQREGAVYRFFQMFQTSLRQYTAVGIRAIQKAKATGKWGRAAKVAYVMFGLLPATFYLIQETYKVLALGDDPPEEAEELFRELAAEILKSPMAGLFLVKLISDDVVDGIVGGKNIVFRESVPLFGIKDDMIRLWDSGYGIVNGEKDATDVIKDISKTVPAANQAGKFIENRLN